MILVAHHQDSSFKQFEMAARFHTGLFFYTNLLTLFFQQSCFTNAFAIANLQRSLFELSSTPNNNDGVQRHPCRRCVVVRSSTSKDSDKLDACLAVAIDAAKQAGQVIRSHDKGAAVVNHKANSRDLLTVVDPLCEKVRNESK